MYDLVTIGLFIDSRPIQTHNFIIKYEIILSKSKIFTQNYDGVLQLPFYSLIIAFPPTTYANLTSKKDTQTKDCGKLEDLTPSEYNKETKNCLVWSV